MNTGGILTVAILGVGVVAAVMYKDQIAAWFKQWSKDPSLNNIMSGIFGQGVNAGPGDLIAKSNTPIPGYTTVSGQQAYTQHDVLKTVDPNPLNFNNVELQRCISSGAFTPEACLSQAKSKFASVYTPRSYLVKSGSTPGVTHGMNGDMLHYTGLT